MKTKHLSSKHRRARKRQVAVSETITPACPVCERREKRRMLLLEATTSVLRIAAAFQEGLPLMAFLIARIVYS